MRGVSFRGPTLAFASVQPSPRVDLICGFDAASSMLVLTYSTGAPPLDPALPSHPFLSSHSCAATSLLSHARAFVLLTILPFPPSFPTRWPSPHLPPLSPLQLFHVTIPLLSQSPASSFPHPTFPWFDTIHHLPLCGAYDHLLPPLFRISYRGYQLEQHHPRLPAVCRPQGAQARHTHTNFTLRVTSECRSVR